MYSFREINPQKTSTNEEHDNYKSYKPILETDFYNKCGYCNDHDYLMGGWREMHIDHFAPIAPFDELKHTYENLVYSCFYCNSAKSNDWVTDLASKPLNDEETEGYIHPREIRYNDLFQRTSTGGIMPIVAVGFYMYTKLNLGLLRHSIIHTMERITGVVEEINEVLERANIKEEVRSTLTANKNKLLDFRDKIERQFRKIVDAR